MPFPVRIQHGNHVLNTQMHALPRKDDLLRCSFPSAGIPTLLLQVAQVSFHQPRVGFEGRECPEPFDIVIEVDEDPDAHAENADAMKRIARGSAPAEP
jgi:hypothetical protein